MVRLGEVRLGEVVVLVEALEVRDGLEAASFPFVAAELGHVSGGRHPHPHGCDGCPVPL